MESKLFVYSGRRYEVMIYDGSDRFRISQLWRNRVITSFSCVVHGSRQAFLVLGDDDSLLDKRARRFFAQIEHNCCLFNCTNICASRQ